MIRPLFCLSPQECTCNNLGDAIQWCHTVPLINRQQQQAKILCNASARQGRTRPEAMNMDRNKTNTCGAKGTGNLISKVFSSINPISSYIISSINVLKDSEMSKAIFQSSLQWFFSFKISTSRKVPHTGSPVSTQ